MRVSLALLLMAYAIWKYRDQPLGDWLLALVVFGICTFTFAAIVKLR